MITKRCISCGREVGPGEYVAFKCPVCGAPIVRCLECRARGTTYVCVSCGFEGP
ncbi:MAG: DUF1610 domain-containing protein [Candidatus Diapherotrites archaeon]|nr:DUF1610 domain-containing protein [Candidatus Diapherotrites archaeon]